MPLQNFTKTLHWSCIKVLTLQKKYTELVLLSKTPHTERSCWVLKKKKNHSNLSALFILKRDIFQMFVSLKWFKGTLKAQKLWSNWAALSSKLSHDNEIHSGLIFWLLPQHATLRFLMRDPIVTIHAKQKPLSLTITPHGYGKKKPSKNHGIKEYLATSHVIKWQYMKSKPGEKTFAMKVLVE